MRALRLSNHSNESPDLGPPPVAHFECEDPIKFDARPAEDQEPAKPATDDNDVLPAAMSINLETRRKRKDLPPRTDKTSSVFVDKAEEQAETQPLRTSAKRKLSVRDSEDVPAIIAKDDFKFSRKAASAADIFPAEVLPQEETVPVKTAGERRRVSASSHEPPILDRRVLGESMFRLGINSGNYS